MKQKNICFNELCESVLSQLKDLGYMDSTLTLYRRFYNRIHTFMNKHGLDHYTEETGQKFLDDLHVCAVTFSGYKCAVRRLNDLINGKPYRYHHCGPSESGPEIYSEIMNAYLEECRDSGNSLYTLDAKRKTCTVFLNYVAHAGCSDLLHLDTGLVSRALLIYSNKDHYARVRMFLKYLAEKEITPADFSGIVPIYKRGKSLPTTYTPEEIRRIEDSVDITTNTGKRNLAIIRLAARMGLRSGDIARLKLSEISFDTGYISIVQEKTGQPLSLQMPQAVSEALLSHLENAENRADDGYVFHSMSAPYGRISTGIIRHAVTESFSAAGICTAGKKHGPHSFRSSLASSMVNDDASYETVRMILGHTDPDVIKHYARVDVKKLRLCTITPPSPSGLFADYLSGKKVVSHV